MSTTEFEVYNITSVIDMNSTQIFIKQPWLDITIDVYTRFTFVWQCVIAPPVCILGIAGNIISMCVLHRDPNNKQQSVYFYLTSILAFDIAFLGFSLLVSTLKLIGNTDPSFVYNFSGYILPFKGYIFVVLRHMIAMMLIVMSLERCMALVFPYTVKQSCVSKNPRFITAVSFVVAATYLLPFTGILGTVINGDDNATDDHNS